MPPPPAFQASARSPFAHTLPLSPYLIFCFALLFMVCGRPEENQFITWRLWRRRANLLLGTARRKKKKKKTRAHWPFCSGAFLVILYFVSCVCVARGVVELKLWISSD